MMKVLYIGVEGAEKDVKRWQRFLRGLGLYLGEVDGDFGPKTDAATRAFQKARGLVVDGRVGPKTYGAALLAGFDSGVVRDTDKGKESLDWPPRPKPGVLRPLRFTEREQLLGHLAWVPAPTKANPERIRITNRFMEDHVVRITVPQLRELAKAHPKGRFPRSGRIYVNRALADAFRELFAAWEEEGILLGLRTFDGIGNPRLVRGSRATLSNHAHYGAVDLNYAWNRLGQHGALAGRKGSLREHAAVAARLGWWCGLWGWPSNGYARKDPMHLEPGSKLAKRIGLKELRGAAGL